MLQLQGAKPPDHGSIIVLIGCSDEQSEVIGNLHVRRLVIFELSAAAWWWLPDVRLAVVVDVVRPSDVSW